jgi:hypothetical protein
MMMAGFVYALSGAFLIFYDFMEQKKTPAEPGP